MKDILTSAAFWTGFTPIALALIALYTRKPKKLLDKLARRQIYDGPENNVRKPKKST